jgi:hypothetical protein
MDEFELRRVFRTRPDLMIEVRRKLGPDSILDLAKRIAGEPSPNANRLPTEADFRNEMEARRRLQARFGVYFPAPSALLGVTGPFCLAAGAATDAQGLPQ